MKRRWAMIASGLLVVAMVLGGCTWFGQKGLVGPQSIEAGENYILTFHKLPKNVEATIGSYGGTVRAVLGEIDAVLVTGDADFLAAIEGVSGFDAAIPDLSIDWLPDIEPKAFDAEHIGSDEWYYGNYQWDMMAIDAPGAWEAGYTGDGVLVAVLDTGIDYLHPDLAPCYAGGWDFVNDDDDPYDDDLDGGHGSNVSGIIAAADDAYGVIGVAPDADILAVKVLDEYGSGDFGWILEGILYAVEQGADVINMSLGAYVSHNGYVRTGAGDVYVGANAIAGLVNAIKKTINYAESTGAFVVASAGNDAHDGTGDAGWMHIPSDVGCTAVVSATGPLDTYYCSGTCSPSSSAGWTLDPTGDFDLFAFYSDYGPQIDFAAPGGNLDFALYPFPGYCHLVFNCFRGGWGWMGGTSQAAPHVAGVAALVIGKNGGDMKPSHVLRELRQSADDLGKPGQDPYYGHGRVNAAQAVAP